MGKALKEISFPEEEGSDQGLSWVTEMIHCLEGNWESPELFQEVLP